MRYTASFQYEVGEYKTSQLQDKESYAVRNKVNTLLLMQVGVARLLIIFLMAIFIQRGLIVSVLIISVSNWILTRHLQKNMM